MRSRLRARAGANGRGDETVAGHDRRTVADVGGDRDGAAHHALDEAQGGGLARGRGEGDDVGGGLEPGPQPRPSAAGRRRKAWKGRCAGVGEGLRSQPGRADDSSAARPGDRLHKSPVDLAHCDRRRSPGAAGLRNPRVGCAIGLRNRRRGLRNRARCERPGNGAAAGRPGLHHHPPPPMGPGQTGRLGDLGPWKRSGTLRTSGTARSTQPTPLNSTATTTGPTSPSPAKRIGPLQIRGPEPSEVFGDLARPDKARALKAAHTNTAPHPSQCSPPSPPPTRPPSTRSSPTPGPARALVPAAKVRGDPQPTGPHTPSNDAITKGQFA
jgi:hypothetical protein